jgi:hypothetical protein
MLRVREREVQALHVVGGDERALPRLAGWRERQLSS